METVPMPAVTPQERVLYNLFRRPVMLGNAKLGRYDDEVIWLFGHGRSGTTWLSELINHDQRLRDMFEPIRPERVERTSFLQRNQYVRPGAHHPELHDFMSDVFSGRFSDVRVDFANRRPLYRGLIIKDVFANLLARWATLEFPAVRPVHLVRNPFAACLSMMKRPRFYAPLAPDILLSQPDLVADHLEPHVDTLERVAAEGDELQQGLANWAVTNLVPMRQFRAGEVHVCFYEEVYRDPEQRIKELLDFSQRCDTQLALSRDKVEKPSRTARGGTVVLNKSPLLTWRDELSADQIRRGLALLDELGVGELYGDGTDPDRSAIDRIRARHEGRG